MSKISKAEWQRGFYKAHPDIVRQRNLWYRWKITPDDYDYLCAIQGDVCAICLQKRPLKIDHDHSISEKEDMKAFRGMLCNGCNVQLGWYENNKKRIEEYVR